MLRKRYEYNSKSILKLNNLQMEMKRQINLKIPRGIYQFESVPCCICNNKKLIPLSKYVLFKTI